MASDNPYAGALAGVLGGAAAGIMGGGIASALGSYNKTLPPLDLRGQTELTGETTSRPEVSGLLRKAFTQSKRQEMLLGHLVDEMASGVIGAGTAQQVARAARADDQIGRAYLDARMQEGSHNINMSQMRDRFVESLTLKSIDLLGRAGADYFSTMETTEEKPEQKESKPAAPKSEVATDSLMYGGMGESNPLTGQGGLIASPISEQEIQRQADMKVDKKKAYPQLGSDSLMYGGMEGRNVIQELNQTSNLPDDSLMYGKATKAEQQKRQESKDALFDDSLMYGGNEGFNVITKGKVPEPVGEGKSDVEMPESVKKIIDNMDDDEKSALISLMGG